MELYSNHIKYIIWVKYSEEYAQFIVRCNEILFDAEPLGDISTLWIKKVGNIYDNKDLLKKEGKEDESNRFIK